MALDQQTDPTAISRLAAYQGLGMFDTFGATPTNINLMNANLRAIGDRLNTLETELSGDIVANSITIAGTFSADTENDKISFYGVTPISRPTGLTTAVTTLTSAGSGGDSDIQALVSSGVGDAYGYVTQAEGIQHVKTTLNNQLRIAQIEAKLTTLGLLT